MPGAVYGWPKNVLHMHGIANSIVDLSATIRPRFAIVDAVTAMEGDGPIMGRPRSLGLIAMGPDPVAVDATCARSIGLAPDRLSYLEMAGRFLGVADETRIEQRGESISRYATQFEVVERLQNLSASQKHLLRMGPSHVQSIQTKLREIADALGIPASRLPPPQ